MKELQLETQKPRKKRFPILLILAGIILAIYILCPPLLVYPLFLACGKKAPPHYLGEAISITFWPIVKLSRHIPPYGRLVTWENRELLTLK